MRRGNWTSLSLSSLSLAERKPIRIYISCILNRNRKKSRSSFVKFHQQFLFCGPPLPASIAATVEFHVMRSNMHYVMIVHAHGVPKTPPKSYRLIWCIALRNAGGGDKRNLSSNGLTLIRPAYFRTGVNSSSMLLGLMHMQAIRVRPVIFR